MPLRMTLRTDTSDDHKAVDHIFGHFDLADRNRYASFLCAHARVLPPIEIALEQAGVEDIIPDWRDRRRRGKLMDDLTALGTSAPEHLPAPTFSTEDEIWGAAYVLEGSKLGGAMLARQVPVEFPSSYLGFQGPKGAMKTFMEKLDEFSPLEEDRAIAAARSVFTLFKRAAELELELIPS
ncbi:biliverdin-producing heme oxygenase [Neorhizobium sp. P12A]|uniref:biliverdin-producing heme oxygenase n=1 Tax=Neorhizobium sp. P12A TaxID=2268027 RepID=UPI0011F03CBD|nr:biliverdin-producing heme oxygenase [Neorhizobium sp. P12A]KAA0700691.1 biliverdin-producing heme oxygenase [Neorhizobium sp. P12A]